MHDEHACTELVGDGGEQSTTARAGDAAEHRHWPVADLGMSV